MRPYEDHHLDIGRHQDDEFLGSDRHHENFHGPNKPDKRNGGIKGASLSHGVEVEYQGLYLEKIDRSRPGEKANWTRVGQRRLPFSDAKLAEIIRRERHATRQDALEAFDNLSRDQQAVVIRVVDTKQALEKNSNAVWNLACVRRMVGKNYRLRTKEVKKILVILKRQSKTTSKTRLGAAARSTDFYRDMEIVDLADPLPKAKLKTSVNDDNAFSHGGGNHIDFALGLGPEFDNFGPIGGGKKNKNLGLNVHDLPFSGVRDTFIDAQIPGHFPGPFAESPSDDKMPIPSAHHDIPYQAPQHQPVHQLHPEPQHYQHQPGPQLIPTDQFPVDHSIPPNVPRDRPRQQPPSHQQQAPHYQTHEPPRQVPLPWEDNPFQPDPQFNQEGNFDLPTDLLNNDPRFGASREHGPRPQSGHERSLSAHRAGRSFVEQRPDGGAFLERVNSWNLNDTHSSNDSFRNDVWSGRDRDSRRSFTPPSSPPRSDYLDGRVYPLGSLHRDRSRKHKRHSEREHDHPREHYHDEDPIEPYDFSRGRCSHRRDRDRDQSPIHYLVDSDIHRKRPIIQRRLTDYPSGPVANFTKRRPRFVEDDFEHEIAGHERRKAHYHRRRREEGRYLDYESRRDGGRRMNVIF